MVNSRGACLAALVLSNILLPVAILTFASGFFPYKPFLPGLATWQDGEGDGMMKTAGSQPGAMFNRVVFMVVDALRSDFVFGHNSGFRFTQSLIRTGAAIPFTAHATPPTVTMPRVKALTTGSVPSFLDLILNFAESDTSSLLTAQDTWLAQIRARDGRLVFYGDDTWLKLFPSDAGGDDAFFARADGTSSFFVSDFTEVDLNVTRHVPRELARDDWNAMILHYLGLDHIGHKTGPQGPNMLPKQREMDDMVRQIYEAMESEDHLAKTLLIVAGDHGMNAGGNHGGSGPGETEPALVFASPRFKEMAKIREYECPTVPRDGTEFHYYTKIEQSDVVPAIAALMGLPIPKNSLGIITPELAALWPQSERIQLMLRNARQMLQVVHAKFGTEAFEVQVSRHINEFKQSQGSVGAIPADDGEKLACAWAAVKHLLAKSTGIDLDKLETAILSFLTQAQETMSDTASSYDIPRMITGMGVIVLALTLALSSLPALRPPNLASLFFATTSILYGAMMFASSYVEEEQHFWYWLTPAWLALLTVKALWDRPDRRDGAQAVFAGVVLLAAHRIVIRWNQTGQKHAGEPDIVHTVFPAHHVLMWLLILTTYVTEGLFLHTQTFAGIFMRELAAFANTTLIVLGIVFKLNFTQADAPELVQGLALHLREWSAPFSLVFQARALFLTLAMTTAAVVALSVVEARKERASQGDGKTSLHQRLHHLLTLFLIAQTRAPNVPLLLIAETQRKALAYLFRHQTSDSGFPPLNPTRRIVEVAASVLLMSHTYYFCMGGSNSISSIDLSNAYNGVADYNIAAVGVLLFASNWAGPIWWCSTAVILLCPDRSEKSPQKQPEQSDGRNWVKAERAKLRTDAIASPQVIATRSSGFQSSAQDSWRVYVSTMTVFVCIGLLAVMAACTALRTHLFIWTVFSPKYLYAMAWSGGWHLVVNIGFGSLLYSLKDIS